MEKQEKERKPLLRVGTVAARLALSKAQVYVLAECGALRAAKIGVRSVSMRMTWNALSRGASGGRVLQREGGISDAHNTHGKENEHDPRTGKGDGTHLRSDGDVSQEHAGQDRRGRLFPRTGRGVVHRHRRHECGPR